MTDSAEEIVKVQLPLAASAGVNPNEGLIYARAQKHMRHQTIPEHARAQLDINRKGYFAAVWLGALGQWVIGRKVEEQPW